jgi:hypothetical protein
VYRDEADLQLLTELAGVLDETVSQAGLGPGAYLLLRRVVAESGPHGISQLASALNADPNEVADAMGPLVAAGCAEMSGAGVTATETGRTLAREIETDANEAMRAYVMDRPHTATVYGLVASMQSGRFGVEDLLEFLEESQTEEGS